MQGLVDALVRALHDDDLCREMVARGMRRAGEFTWDRVARSFLAVYQEVAPGG